MSAEEDIRRLMGTYIQAHDAHDVDAIVKLFAENGVFANHNGDFKGLPAIRGFFEGSRARATAERRGKLLCANSVITVDGDTAEALSDVVGLQRNGSDPWTISLVAQYADKFVHHDGDWLYLEKRVIV